MSQSCKVQVRFFSPPEDLRRYFTTFYLLEVSVRDGATVTDWLHPEWANLRFCSGTLPLAKIHDGGVLSGADFAVTGPSSKAVKFTIGDTRLWGIGLLPLGWATFVRTPAAQLANTAFAGRDHPAFAQFLPLAQTLCGGTPDAAAELDRIAAHFRATMPPCAPDHERIVAIHAALVDPDTSSVAELAERVGAGKRTVERVCERAFGFSPRMLLRRQRFMRSLAHFVLDPSLKWIGAIDDRYHDQAQFVRDFREFIGMTPRQYAALDKPILSEVMRARASSTGAAVQTLDTPAGGGLRG